MNTDINIIIKEYDEKNNFIIVKRKHDNLYMDLGICQFIDEMEYWDMPTRGDVKDGENGFVFSKQTKVEDIEEEIKRFVNHNGI